MLCLVPVTGRAVAWQAESRPSTVSQYVYTLRHQPAREAVPLILPLLSESGAVELRPGGNTLVIWDTSSALESIVAVLQDLDHPIRALELHLRLVAAAVSAASRPPGPAPADDLLDELGEVLPYDNYTFLAETRVRTREGEEVAYRLGDLYQVRFRVGTVLLEQRLKLYDFQVFKRESERQPHRMTLNLWLGKTTVVGLSSRQDGNPALMVVIDYRAMNE